MAEDNNREFTLPEIPMNLPIAPPKQRPDHSVTVATDYSMPFAREIPEDVIEVSSLLTQICGDWPRQERPEPGSPPTKPFAYDPEYEIQSSVCGMLVDPEGYAVKNASVDHFEGALAGAAVASALILGLMILRIVWRWVGSFFDRQKLPVHAPLPLKRATAKEPLFQKPGE